MTVALARRPVTPYARRLARERGLPLDAIAGSGPGGRIVAADIEAFVACPAAVPTSAPAATAAAIAALQATIDLTNLRRLLADFAAASVTLTVDDVLVRASGLALEASTGSAGHAVAWEVGSGVTRREVLLQAAGEGPIGRLHDRLAAGLADTATHDNNAPPAALSIRRIRQAGIRPTAMPLLSGHALRLIACADDAAAVAECLLCFDTDRVGDDEAAAFLAHLRKVLELPLLLLA